MAKRNEKDPQRRRMLPDPEDLYFDDDLDSVTRGLPTEKDHAEAPTSEEAPRPRPMTEGISRSGVRMFGLAPEQDEDPAEYAEDDSFAYGEEAAEGAPAYRYDPTYDEDEGDESPAVSRPAATKAAPMPAARRRKQQRVLPDEDEHRTKHPVLRIFLLTTVTVVLLGSIGMMMLARTMYPDMALLKMPDQAVANSVGPVQNFFSGFVEIFGDYFRTLKLRANLEQAYVELAAKNEELAIGNAMAYEYARRLAQYEDIDAEIQNNLDLNPLRCQVIGAEQGSYFSTFTINAGRNHGINEYMAVTIGGALVGYTEKVYDNTATVRTIIDSDASIAALIQSSRDQGIVRGTLGEDGQAMCRMYYLPENHLPRPGDIVVTSGVGMSFPKGIPIGTVRESTRRMESNKQYIVVEPQVDFEHLEYVIVLRYQPTAEAVQSRTATMDYNSYEPTVSARPYPTLRIGTTLRFGETATPVPSMSVTPTPTPSPTPRPTPTPTPAPTATGTVYQYNSNLLGPTATPTASPTPSPTPVVTLRPGDLTWEEE